MLDSVLRLAEDSSYDFRLTANPEDPLKEHFSEWVPYYRLKWAIARVLQPKTILEIGVRYGYSAAAFLAACPEAKYTGLDLDIAEFGGSPGALDWARKSLGRYNTELLCANTQEMQRLPGDMYDLIHVDGQQDGDGTFHDMELALSQGRCILADGYMWTRTNFAALNEFLFTHRDAIDSFGVIPGYAGELLIKVKGCSREPAWVGYAKSSAAIQHTYTADYYLQDCGGYAEYRRSNGKKLDDTRLRGIAMLAGIKPKGRVLDLGCGRGELSYYFAQRGYDVTAIDYSSDAIEIAKKTFSGDSDLVGRVKLVCGDVCKAAFDGRYDLAVASDLVEHLADAELETLYARVARHLKFDGIFLVHTFPNRWFYQYEYARKRRLAASLGCYLAPNPRTEYERLMHINEQSPRQLRRSLKRHFEHVMVWFGDAEHPGGSLLRRYTKQELRASEDLFAVASPRGIPIKELRATVETRPLSDADVAKMSMKALATPQQVSPGDTFTVQVEVENNGKAQLNSCPPFPVHLSYHWMKGPEILEFEGLRTPLWPPLGNGDWVSYTMQIKAPASIGDCQLKLTLVQENVRWLEVVNAEVSIRLG